jgi:hypothetical protein
MARWWARMETILPYRRRRAAREGRRALARFYATHLPHYAWRTACRTYVGARKGMASPSARLPMMLALFALSFARGTPCW